MHCRVHSIALPINSPEPPQAAALTDAHEAGQALGVPHGRPAPHGLPCGCLCCLVEQRQHGQLATRRLSHQPHALRVAPVSLQLAQDPCDARVDVLQHVQRIALHQGHQKAGREGGGGASVDGVSRVWKVRRAQPAQHHPSPREGKAMLLLLLSGYSQACACW